MWVTRGLLVVVVVAVTLAGCDDDADEVTAGDRATTTVLPGREAETEDDGLRLVASWAPDPLEAGEAVKWGLILVNERDEPVAMSFGSAQEGDVVLFDDGTEVYRWSDDRAFAQAIREERLEPGGRLEAALVEERLDVEPGAYTLRAEIAADPAPPPVETRVEVS